MNLIDYNFNKLVNDIKSLSRNELYYVIRKNFDKIPDETKMSCSNFFNNFLYWGRLDVERNDYEEIEKKVDVLYEHIADFVWLYNHLEDYRSKKTLFAVLNNWYQYDFITSLEARENMYDDYFDLDLVKCDNNEVIVDLGAYVGDTVLSYIKNYGKDCYKKIYCYEITKDTFEILKNNLKEYDNVEFRLKGVGNKTCRMRVVDNVESTSANILVNDENGEVEVVTLDQDIKDKITMIKSDIEGMEQEALEGAKNHIINDHPKLLISVYHGNDDLWKIPKMIYEMSPDYKFYLRHHGSNIYPTEITLIAI